MNLVAIAALIAVCGAAKLDRAYLPPASAKTAGGSPGALQAPFGGNNGLGGLPKGGYENDFQGVVVDAAAAGTRASGVGDTGLGAPRISYGSTDSKVGAAAFKTGPAAFRPQSDGQAVAQGFQPEPQLNERPRASLDRNAGILRYENEVGPESYHFAFETDNGIQAEENGVATNGVQAQGGFSYTGDDGQVYSVSYTADEGGYQPKGDHLPTPPPIPIEILKSLEQNARDEAAGLVDDGSYDAQKYNTANDYTESDNANGKYTHQSSKFGSSEADATPSGTFINQNNQPFRRPNAGQSAFNGQTGQGSSLAGQNQASGFGQSGFSGQANGQAGQGSSLNGQKDSVSGFEQSGFGVDAESESNGQISAQSGQSSNRFPGQFGQSPNSVPSPNKGSSSFGQFGQAATSQGQNGNKFGSSSSVTAQTEFSGQGNGFGNRNEYLPPVNTLTQNGRPQTGRPQNGRPQNTRPQNGRPQGRPQTAPVNAEGSAQTDVESNVNKESTANFVPLGQQDLQSESRPQASVTSFGKPISNGLSTQNGFGSSGNQYKPSNGRRPLTNGNTFAQGQSSQSGNAVKPNEYLPPVNGNQYQRPQNRPQGPNNGAQSGQQFNADNQDSVDLQSPQGRPQGFLPSASAGTQSSFGAQSQKPNSFQRPQSSTGLNGNQYTSQTQSQFGTAPAQSASGFGSSSQPTSQPDIELSTPLEPVSNSLVAQTDSEITASGFNTPSTSVPSNGRPTFGNQFNKGQNGFGSRPQGSNAPVAQTQTPAFPTQSSFGQFNQNSQFGSQSQSQNSFGQDGDVQTASSTQRPSYQQPQGPDDSYYYNQPARPFGSPQGTRFPSAPSNQLVTMTQQSSFAQSSKYPDPPRIPSTFLSGQFQGSNKQPRPPTLAPTAPTSQAQSQFVVQTQGSTKYPRPPTVAPIAPTSASQYQGSTNGITQASISSFPAQSPTQASQFNNQGQFGSRPSYQQSSQFSQTQTSQPAVPSFGQKPTQPSFGQQSSTSPQRPFNKFQSQTFGQQPSTPQEEVENVEEEKPVASQQYTGEIYEYNKPAITLPPPDSTPASTVGQFGLNTQSQGQFGAQPSRPQFGQTSDEDDQRPTSQFGGQSTQTVQGSRPQFGGSSRPQFGQAQAQNFGDKPETTEDLKPYGALAQNSVGAQGTQQSGRPQFGAQGTQQTGRPQFGAQNAQQSGSRPQFGAQTIQQSGSRPQFGAQGRPQFGQTQAQSTFGAQTEDKTPQFGAQPGTDAEPQMNSEGTPDQFGFISPCCKEEFGRKPTQSQGAQSQFGQSSFASAQTYKPEPTSSFAGKGEEFGGPRQPPSFDDETGYHY